MLPLTSVAQVFLDFTSPDCLRGWSGDTGSFQCYQEQLRSASTRNNDTFGIRFPALLEAEWEIALDCKLDFNTSSANYVEYILFGAADSTLVLRLGGSADEILLSLATGSVQALGNQAAGTTERSAWQLRFVQQAPSGLMINCRKTSTEETFSFPTGLHWKVDSFGILVRQSTSSFFQRHYFDNMYFGPVRRDVIPPRVEQLWVQRMDQLNLRFSEPVDTILSKDVFDLEGQRIKALFDDENSVKLHWNDQQFPNDSDLALNISGLTDLSGNVADTTLMFHYLFGEAPRPGELRFTELMPDPDPTVQLPLHEFMELTNTGSRFLSTSGLAVRDPGTSTNLGEYILRPGASIILCRATDSAGFSPYGRVVGVGSFPALNNDHDSLWLYMTGGSVIDSIFYDVTRHSDNWKSAGGWTLELSTLEKACLGFAAWGYSNSWQGGTPGRFEQDPDLADPVSFQLSGWELKGAENLQLTFNATPDPEAGTCSLVGEDKMGLLLRFRGLQAETHLPVPLKAGVAYTLVLDQLADCMGQKLDSSITVGLPIMPEPGMLLLSEVLFNPPPNGSDFIEIYNASSLLLDASDLLVFSKDSAWRLTHLAQLVSSQLLIPPGMVAAFTADPNGVRSHFKPVPNASIFLSKTIPPLADQSGYIGIHSRAGEFLDTFCYRDDMHSLLLHNREAVSLECLFGENPVPYNKHWVSSSSMVNFASPGYRNRPSLSEEHSARFSVYPQKISPDWDGVDDLAVIRWVAEDMDDATLHISVFDREGNFIRNLKEGLLSRGEDITLWDGTSVDGKPMPVGDYVILAMVRYANGRSERYKAALTLIR